MKKWKQILLDIDTYNSLKKAKSAMAENHQASLSFSDIIRILMKKDMHIVVLDPEVRAYITAYVAALTEYKGVLGVILFGSVARGTWNKYSDIDLFIVVDGNPLFYLNKTDEIDKKLYNLQKRLFQRGLGLYVSPLIVNKSQLADKRIIYAEIAKDGIVLYDKGGIMESFIDSTLNQIEYVPVKNGNERFIKWKEKKI